VLQREGKSLCKMHFYMVYKRYLCADVFAEPFLVVHQEPENLVCFDLGQKATSVVVQLLEVIEGEVGKGLVPRCGQHDTTVLMSNLSTMMSEHLVSSSLASFPCSYTVRPKSPLSQMKMSISQPSNLTVTFFSLFAISVLLVMLFEQVKHLGMVLSELFPFLGFHLPQFFLEQRAELEEVPMP
jgi:hypothetical protein